MQVLIDGDIVGYRCATSCLKQGVLVEPLEIAIMRCDELMHRILFETQSTSYRVFLSNGETFRHRLYPAYKANRPAEKPAYLQDIREHLVTAWKAELAMDIEADDLMGIAQSEASLGTTVIASIDKDLLQVPGKHYNFVKGEHYDISSLTGRHNFWMQMIMGDRSDNIPGYDGKMRTAIPKFLQPLVDDLYECETEEEMQTLVKDVYTDQDQFEINKTLFHILRKPLEEY